MTNTCKPVAVLGAGSWGTALAIQLCRAGGRVRLWGHEAELMADISAARCNDRYSKNSVPIKDIYVYPLDRHYKELLQGDR